MSDLDQSTCYDIAIVGSGPIGLELAVLAKRAGLSVIQFDSGPVAAKIQSYPQGTELFSLGERLAIGGVPFTTPNQRRPTREQYLDYLVNVCKLHDLKVNTFERVDDIYRDDGYFVVSTKMTKKGSIVAAREIQVRHEYKSKFVVLAVGDLHESRLLGVDGEQLSHVHHQFKTPFCYAGSSVLVVGGRHSALGTAIRLSSLNCKVTLVHRGPEIDQARTKAWIYIEFEKRVAEGSIRFHPNSVVNRIEENAVLLKTLIDGKVHKVMPIDFVLPLVGYKQDKSLFKSAGVELLGACQSPSFKGDTMETNIEGIFVAGTGVAGDQIGGAKFFIDNTHEHCDKIIESICARS